MKKICAIILVFVFLVSCVTKKPVAGTLYSSDQVFSYVASQPDSTTLRVRERGDEFVNWVETDDTDCFYIIKNSKGVFEYATIIDTLIAPSGIKAHNKKERTSEEQNYARQQIPQIYNWLTQTSRVKVGNLYYYLNHKNKTAQVTCERLFSSNNYALTPHIIIPDQIIYDGIHYKVTSIRKNAFSVGHGSRGTLKSIFIPHTIENIDADAFQESWELEEINVAQNNPRYTTLEGVLFDKKKITIICCPASKKGMFEIPASVEIVGKGAFAYSNVSITTIPEKVHRIDECGFYHCSGLSSTIKLPKNLCFIGAHAFGYDNIREIVIPEGVDSIGRSAFYSDQDLRSVILPNSLAYIGEHAFGGCSSLKSIILPPKIKEIRTATFEHCYHLQSITISKNITDVSANAFMYCNLHEIIVPKGQKERLSQIEGLREYTNIIVER